MLVLLVSLIGLMGMTAGSASAQLQPGEGCVPEGDRFIIGLADPDRNGVITIAELQLIADNASPGEQQDTFNDLIDQAEAQGVTGLRYNIEGPCPPPVTATPPTVTATPPTVTATPPTVTATATTPVTTATVTATATETATTTATATTTTTVTETATATATTAPSTTAPDDDGDDDGVSELPDTGQGSTGDQANSTFVMLLGGMSLFIAAAFLWIQRRAA